MVRNSMILFQKHFFSQFNNYKLYFGEEKLKSEKSAVPQDNSRLIA